MQEKELEGLSEIGSIVNGANFTSKKFVTVITPQPKMKHFLLQEFDECNVDSGRMRFQLTQKGN